MSGDTPIYDATCRAVGQPPLVDRTAPAATDEAHRPQPEVSSDRAPTEARSAPSTQPAGPSPQSPADDPSTAELWFADGYPSPPHVGRS
jgi:hypothetical protein